MNSNQAPTSATIGGHPPIASSVDEEWITTLEPLDVEECWQAVYAAATSSVGRLAFVGDGGQQLLPVNYAVARRSIVVRTAWGGKLSQLASGGEAAFEIDHVDPQRRTGWSVMIQGRIWPINRPAETLPDDLLHLHPWAAGDRDCWIRLVPTTVTGRSICRQRASHPDGPLPYMAPD